MFGGILEHPRSSTLWTSGNFSLSGGVDSYGGFLRSVDLSWFGFPARKATMLYFVGIAPSSLPSFPLPLAPPTHVVGGKSRVSRLEELPKSQRSITPAQMIDYFAQVYQFLS